LYPPESTDISFLPELQSNFKTFVKEKPAELPGWLFEPDENAIRELSAVLQLRGVPTSWGTSVENHKTITPINSEKFVLKK
jgi:hypothetical protein